MTDAEREALVTGNLRLVPYVANRFARRTVPRDVFEEMVAVGNVALVKAARHFDPERGFTFATYASKAIFAELAGWRDRQRPMGQFAVDGHGAELIPADPRAADPAELAAQADAGDPLAEALAALPDGDREVLVRRFWGGETLGEIGLGLGVSKEAVRVRQVKAMEKVATAMRRARRGAVAAPEAATDHAGVIG